MNCKPGDLVVVINAKKSKHNIGRIVTVVCQVLDDLGDVGWSVTPTLFHKDGRPVYGFADNHLRPIRPDETPEESTEAMKKLHHIPSKETA